MNYPSARMILHVAGELDDRGQQRCQRCEMLIFDTRSGAPTLWYPGQDVAISESGSVRMSIPPGKAGEYGECAPP